MRWRCLICIYRSLEGSGPEKSSEGRFLKFSEQIVSDFFVECDHEQRNEQKVGHRDDELAGVEQTPQTALVHFIDVLKSGKNSGKVL
jgi:hypothetical protein